MKNFSRNLVVLYLASAALTAQGVWAACPQGQKTLTLGSLRVCCQAADGTITSETGGGACAVNMSGTKGTLRASDDGSYYLADDQGLPLKNLKGDDVIKVTNIRTTDEPAGTSSSSKSKAMNANLDRSFDSAYGKKDTHGVTTHGTLSDNAAKASLDYETAHGYSPKDQTANDLRFQKEVSKGVSNSMVGAKDSLKESRSIFGATQGAQAKIDGENGLQAKANQANQTLAEKTNSFNEATAKQNNAQAELDRLNGQKVAGKPDAALDAKIKTAEADLQKANTDLGAATTGKNTAEAAAGAADKELAVGKGTGEEMKKRGTEYDSELKKNYQVSGQTYQDNGYVLEGNLNGKGPCKVTDTYGGNNPSCNATKNWVQTAQVSNMTTQLVGSTVTQIQGQNAYQQAATAGTQAAAIDAAADVQENTGNMQIGAGVINVLMSGVQFWRGIKHSKTNERIGEEIDKDRAQIKQQAKVYTNAGHGQDLSNDIEVGKDSKGVQNFALNGVGTVVSQQHLVDKATTEAEKAAATEQAHRNRQDGLERKSNAVASQLNKIAGQVETEQTTHADMAKQGGLMSLMAALPQFIQGGANRATAVTMRNTAQQLRDEANKAPSTMSFALPSGGMGQQQVQGAGGGVAITGSGNENSATGDQPVEQANNAPFDDKMGDPFAPAGNPVDPLAAGPEAKIGQAGGGTSGGGAAGLGGGSTGPGEQTNENEATARYAGNLGEGAGYANSGGGAYAGGGGGGGAEGGGPDLSGMLDKLMGKSGETAFRGKPGLDEFGRGLASEPYSYLDKNVNIFDRIHQAYQVKSKAGRL